MKHEVQLLFPTELFSSPLSVVSGCGRLHVCGRFLNSNLTKVIGSKHFQRSRKSNHVSKIRAETSSCSRYILENISFRSQLE